MIKNLDRQKYSKKHPEQQPGEFFVSNINKDHLDGFQSRPFWSGYEGIRVGEIAYDKSDNIDPGAYPVFATKFKGEL